MTKGEQDGRAPIREDVLNVARSSGFPLEVRTVRVLAAHNYAITPGWAFRDALTEASRNMDIVAWRDFEVEGDAVGGGFVLHLVVECKRTAAMVVFRTESPQHAMGHLDSLGFHYFGEPAHLWGRSEPRVGVPLHDVLKLGDALWPWQDVTGGHCGFLKSAKGGTDFALGDEGFYEKKLLPLMAACVERRRSFFVPSRMLPRPRTIFNVLVPLLVIEGALWSHDAVTDDTCQVDSASLWRTHDGAFAAAMRIDVVTYQFLGAYLAALHDQMAIAADTLSARAERLSQSLEFELGQAAQQSP